MIQSLERIEELRDWLRNAYGDGYAYSEDGRATDDLIRLLDEKAEQLKAGWKKCEPCPFGPPSPGSPSEDERALDTLQDAAREGYPYVYEFNSDKELWWADVLKAIAHLRSRLAEGNAKAAPPGCASGNGGGTCVYPVALSPEFARYQVKKDPPAPPSGDVMCEICGAVGHLKPIPVTVTEDDIDDALEGPMDGLVKNCCNICEDSGLCFGTVKEAIIKMLREKGIGVTVVEAEGK